MHSSSSQRGGRTHLRPFLASRVCGATYSASSAAPVRASATGFLSLSTLPPFSDPFWPLVLTASAHRMKALIYVLVRAFEFELAVPVEDIQKKSSIVQRPVLRKAPEEGSQMPLLVRRVKHA